MSRAGFGLCAVLLTSGGLVTTACGPATYFAVKGSDEIVRSQYDPLGRGLEVTLTPAPPWTLAVGEELSLELKSVLGTGESCRTCSVEWASEIEDIAGVREPDPSCRLGRCAVVSGSSPGRTRIEVKVCVGIYEDCKIKRFELVVIPD